MNIQTRPKAAAVASRYETLMVALARLAAIEAACDQEDEECDIRLTEALITVQGNVLQAFADSVANGDIAQVNRALHPIRSTAEAAINVSELDTLPLLAVLHSSGMAMLQARQAWQSRDCGWGPHLNEANALQEAADRVEGTFWAALQEMNFHAFIEVCGEALDAAR